MLGAFRGMPTWLATLVVSMSACSQDPQFTEKDLTSAFTASDDLTAESCDALAAASGGAMPNQCLLFKAQLSVEPAASEMMIGESRNLRAVLSLPDGRTFDVTGETVWSVADERLLTINKGGSVTALASGSVPVQASYYKTASAASVKILALNVPKDPRVELKIQGLDVEMLKAPSGKDLNISWQSQDVDGCRLLVNDREFDRRSIGAVDLKAKEDQKISVICQAAGGDEIRDDVQVFVTRPKVDLTVNSVRDSLTIDGPATVEVHWVSENADITDCP